MTSENSVTPEPERAPTDRTQKPPATTSHAGQQKTGISMRLDDGTEVKVQVQLTPGSGVASRTIHNFEGHEGVEGIDFIVLERCHYSETTKDGSVCGLSGVTQETSVHFIPYYAFPASDRYDWQFHVRKSDTADYGEHGA